MTLFADCGGREIYNYAMTRKMQACVLDGSLHTFTAFLNGSVGQANDGYAGEPICVIYFYFDDYAFKSHHGTGIYSREHGVILTYPFYKTMSIKM